MNFLDKIRNNAVIKYVLIGVLAIAAVSFTGAMALHYSGMNASKDSSEISTNASNSTFTSDSISKSSLFSALSNPASSFDSSMSSSASTLLSSIPVSSTMITSSTPAIQSSSPSPTGKATSPAPTVKAPTPTTKIPTPVITQSSSGAIIINHSFTHLSSIPSSYITAAKSQLHIAYGHTSHGSQLITGMQGLIDFKGSLYNFNSGGSSGSLDLRDAPFAGAYDLGNPDFTAWDNATRTYLNSNPVVNVVMWSWCGQVSGASASDITGYLNRMNTLEHDYPNVRFVYFTGHLDGSGLEGNLHLRNEQIRTFCRNNNKILYDFEDIESYNPDGSYFGDKYPDDGCNFNSGN